MDYYGQNEDVAIFKMSNIPYDDIHSMIQNQTMIDTPVSSIISEIDIVNERQSLFENETLVYEVQVTRGIIFKFKDGHEISFEKEIWFSEDISVKKGYDLIQQFSSTDEFEEAWSDEYRGECTRDTIVIK